MACWKQETLSQPLSRNRVPATADPAEPRRHRQRAVPLSSSNVGFCVLSGTEPETNPGSPEWTAWQGHSLSLCPHALCSVCQGKRRPSFCPESCMAPRASSAQVSQIGTSCRLGPDPTAQGLQAERAMTTVFYSFDRIWGAQTSVHRACVGLRGT